MTFGFSEKGENRLEAIRSPRTGTRRPMESSAHHCRVQLRLSSCYRSSKSSRSISPAAKRRSNRSSGVCVVGEGLVLRFRTVQDDVGLSAHIVGTGRSRWSSSRRRCLGGGVCHPGVRPGACKAMPPLAVAERVFSKGGRRRGQPAREVPTAPAAPPIVALLVI
jgi:hypothetical protein